MNNTIKQLFGIALLLSSYSTVIESHNDHGKHIPRKCCPKKTLKCCPRKPSKCPRDTKDFEWVDVFAEAPFQGNPLKVVLDAGCLTDEQLQTLASEFGGSETTFVLTEKPINGAWPTRIFTPTQELPFAGHPTLGTAWVIRKLFFCDEVDTIILNYVNGIGRIVVNFEEQANGEKIPFFTSNQGQFLQVFDNAQIDLIADAFDPTGALNLKNFIVRDASLPVQTVNTGLPFIIVPIEDSPEGLAALQGIDAFNAEVIARQLAFLESSENEDDACCFLFFTKETVNPEVQAHVRVFAASVGVIEDPATGSGNSDFAAYAAFHEIFGSPQVNFQVEQGLELERPSLIFLRANKLEDGTVPSGDVGGNTVEVMKGTINITCPENGDSQAVTYYKVQNDTSWIPFPQSSPWYKVDNMPYVKIIEKMS